jgi:hypothetical protein
LKYEICCERYCAPSSQSLQLVQLPWRAVKYQSNKQNPWRNVKQSCGDVTLNKWLISVNQVICFILCRAVEDMDSCTRSARDPANSSRHSLVSSGYGTITDSGDRATWSRSEVCDTSVTCCLLSFNLWFSACSTFSNA